MIKTENMTLEDYEKIKDIFKKILMIFGHILY